MYGMMNKGNISRAWRRLAQFICQSKAIRMRILHPELADDSDGTDAQG